MKLLILFFSFLSINTFSLELESLKDKSLGISVKLRNINQHTILDPTVEFAKFKINGKTYSFKSKDLFIKKTRGKKSIFGRTGKYFVHLTTKSLSANHFVARINLRDLDSKKTLSLTKIVKKSVKNKIAKIAAK